MVALRKDDDNQHMRRLIGHMLRAFGVGNIVLVTNASEGLDNLRDLTRPMHTRNTG